MERGEARAMFAAVLLVIDGILNIIYGLAALGDSKLLDHPTHYLLGTLNNWGWVSLILGILELVAAGSVIYGHRFGRYFGIAVGSLVAIEALLDLPAEPLWSIAVFGISLWIIHGLAMYSDAKPKRADGSLGADEAVAPGPPTYR
ncbi:MAG: hypothetical protein ACLPV4_19085 [Solirubrobacteraceae bacterium]